MTLLKTLRKGGVYGHQITGTSVSLDGDLVATFEGGRILVSRDGEQVAAFERLRDAVRALPGMISDALWAEFRRECRQIADDVAEEGYPDHGSNYDLRVEGLYLDYAGMYGVEFTGEKG